MAEGIGRAGRTILVVEDDYVLASELAYALHDKDAELISPAASTEAALQLVRTAPEVDGALLDARLRGEMAFPLRTRCLPAACRSCS